MQCKLKITGALLTAIILTAGVKIAVLDYSENRELRTAFWVKKTHDKKKRNLVIGGDSRVLQGIFPSVIDTASRYNFNGINLAYPGTSFSNEYLKFIISRLDTSVKPSILVLGLSPVSFTTEAIANESFNQYTQVSALDQFRAQHFSKYLHHLAPYEVNDLLQGVLDKKLPYIKEYGADGSLHIHANNINTERALSDYRRKCGKRTFNKQMLAWLGHATRIAYEQGITVVVFRTPADCAIQEIENSLEGFSEAHIKQTLIDSGANWINFACEDFQTFDGSHLTSQSGEHLSMLLAMQLDEILESHTVETKLQCQVSQ